MERSFSLLVEVLEMIHKLYVYVYFARVMVSVLDECVGRFEFPNVRYCSMRCTD